MIGYRQLRTACDWLQTTENCMRLPTEILSQLEVERLYYNHLHRLSVQLSVLDNQKLQSLGRALYGQLN